MPNSSDGLRCYLCRDYGGECSMDLKDPKYNVVNKRCDYTNDGDCLDCSDTKRKCHAKNHCN